MQHPTKLFKSWLLLLVAALLYASCQGPEQALVPPTLPIQQSLRPIRQLPVAGAGLQSLQQGYPAKAVPAGTRRQAGCVPTPWGWLDTTRVLALQRPGGRPYYTFVLQSFDPAGANGAFQRLLMYPAGAGMQAMLFTYVPAAARRAGQPFAGQPFAGQVQVANLEGAGLGTFSVAGGQWQAMVPRAGIGQRSQSTQSCVQDVVTYYEGQDCQAAVSNTTGLPLPEELQGNCHLIVELVYGPCSELAGGAGPGSATLGQGPGSPGTSLPPTGGSSPGSAHVPEHPDVPEDPILTSPLAELDLSLLLALESWGQEHINDSTTPQCVQDVMRDLKTWEGDKRYTLYAILLGFELDKEPDYNWNIVNASLPPHKNAQTSNYDPNTKSITTTIDMSKYQNATDLALVATLYHELMHAYLGAELELRPIFSMYTLRELILAFDSTQNNNAAHHSAIIDRYVKDIKLVLKEYGDSKGYSLSDSVYYALSWKGLTSTKEFADKDPAEQNFIKNTILAEQAGIDLNGRPQTPRGAKLNCK